MILKGVEIPDEFKGLQARTLMCQSSQLESLKRLVAVCQSHKLRYYISAGTALGAARHKGFIPWDDDIDLVMPRPDYEKLADLIFSCETNMQAYEWKRTKDYRLKSMKVGPVELSSLDHSISAIDVFALDRAPCCNLEYKVQCWLKIFFTQVNHSRCGYLRGMKGLAYSVLGWWVPRDVRNVHRMLEWLIRYRGEWNSQSKIGYWWSTCRQREFVELDVFGAEGGVDVEFEGQMFKAPKQLDFYLTRQFGNWRELPPLEKRLPHHVDDDPWFYSQLAKK